MTAPSSFDGNPAPEVVAAIVAAVQAALPRTVVAEPERPASIWRFSNRWWVPRRSPAADRQRP